MKKPIQKALSVALSASLAATVLAGSASAATADNPFKAPTEPRLVKEETLTTLTQRAATEIPIVFGLNIKGGNVFSGAIELAGTDVNVNPDLEMWNFNYLYPNYKIMSTPTGADPTKVKIVEDKYGGFYTYLGNELTNANGLYNSGGANQVYAVLPDHELGYAVDMRTDVIIGFNSTLLDEIDIARKQDGNNDYNPLIIDVQTGSVTSRMYAWTDMGQAIGAYLDEHPDMNARYGDPYVTAVDVEQFSAGIPYYIASLIAEGDIEKKTAAYVTGYDSNHNFTCKDPGTVGNVSADVYAEVNNFDFITGTYTLDQLMGEGIDLLILGASGYSYNGSDPSETIPDTDKGKILKDLSLLGYTEDQVPLIMDSDSIGVTIGNNGYNYSPITCMFLPYVQAYAYMDALEEVNPAINPTAMVQFMVEEFFHVKDTDEISKRVAQYYIGHKWDNVFEGTDNEVLMPYDRVPNTTDYVYDTDAIKAAIQDGMTYALSDAAAENGNELLPAYRTTDTAYKLIKDHLVDKEPSSTHQFITLEVMDDEGTYVTKYLDLTELEASEPSTQEFITVRTQYQAIVEYYNDQAEYGYGDDLQTTLQNYANHMNAHVWVPTTGVAGTYGENVSAEG